MTAGAERGFPPAVLTGLPIREAPRQPRCLPIREAACNQGGARRANGVSCRTHDRYCDAHVRDGHVLP